MSAVGFYDISVSIDRVVAPPRPPLSLQPAAPSPPTFPFLAHNALQSLLPPRSPRDPARTFDGGMSNQGHKISKRQLQEERREHYQRGRAERKSAQDSIKNSLPFDLPNQPCVHLLKSKYGP
ncbi:hypothetical protein BDV95DRAFT_607356 [Massariosphaeria phaeospora]|uniref:Uncharacterized protein n=1 Tax=Massariosphaeria phaeospora TaxID=100035 RepID=A0A7C8I542_9PLEO|nr:hypothetical protein BDV95DRAFT_607356 [Massariosphaeria phaeospora]